MSGNCYLCQPARNFDIGDKHFIQVCGFASCGRTDKEYWFAASAGRHLNDELFAADADTRDFWPLLQCGGERAQLRRSLTCHKQIIAHEGNCVRFDGQWQLLARPADRAPAGSMTENGDLEPHRG